MKQPSLFKLILFTIIFLGIIESCDKDDVLKTNGGFPFPAKNLILFNSEYDDYNSALEPGEYDMFAFVFSSNRKSKGNDFDIIHYTIGMSYLFEKDVVSIEESAGNTDIGSGIIQMLPDINTINNEFGPYIYPYNINGGDRESEFIFFFAQGEENNLDIKYTIYERDLSENAKYAYKWNGPHDFNLINTIEFSEGYVSIINDDIYYCSNMSGSFDIYKKTLPQDTDLINFLNQPNDQETFPIAELNSNADDKCPYIVDDNIVFSSNRDGGFGGYDLWYSKMINGQWSEPQNFGSSVNSEFDEYRPIVKKYQDIRNDMMIFSSNRSGGKGGFDLYYVGINETR